MFEGKTCKIPNQTENGTCKIREECPAYNDLFANTTSSRISFIKRLNCKDILSETMICCPDVGIYK